VIRVKVKRLKSCRFPALLDEETFPHDLYGRKWKIEKDLIIISQYLRKAFLITSLARKYGFAKEKRGALSLKRLKKVCPIKLIFGDLRHSRKIDIHFVLDKKRRRKTGKSLICHQG
jgi:hypothetical protein